MKKITALVFVLFFVFAAASWAHPPENIIITFDGATSILNIEAAKIQVVCDSKRRQGNCDLLPRRCQGWERDRGAPGSDGGFCVDFEQLPAACAAVDPKGQIRVGTRIDVGVMQRQGAASGSDRNADGFGA